MRATAMAKACDAVANEMETMILSNGTKGS